jgi:HK97 family phage portal protein
VTLLGALARRSVENPTLPLTSTALADWLSGSFTSGAGVPVNERTVYGLGAWYRAIALMAGTIAALPLHVYRIGTRERATQGFVLDSPSRHMTPFEFWQTMVANALTWGTGYGRKVRNAAGIVVEVLVIHPSRVEVLLVDATADNPAGKLYRVHDRRGHATVYGPADIFELPYLSLDGTVGLRPLELFRQTLGSSIATERTGARLWANDAKVGGVLETDANLDRDQARRLLQGFRDAYAGAENAGKVALLDNGTKYSKIALPPDDAELLDSRKFTVSEVARIFGIPPHMLGDVERSTSWGSGIESQMIGFVQFTLLPWLKLIEQRATRDLLPGGWTTGSWYAEYAVEGLLRGDSAARAAFYHQAITDGWLSRAEVRSKENLEPGPDSLEEYLVPSNLTLVQVDGQLVPLGGTNAGQASDTSAA